MVVALPIIAFNIPYYEDYLFNGVNALLIPTEDRKLEEHLLMLIEDETLRRKLSLNSIKLAKEKIFMGCTRRKLLF